MSVRVNSDPHQDLSRSQRIGRGVGVSLLGIGTLIGVAPMLHVEAAHSDDPTAGDKVLTADYEFGTEQQLGGALALAGLVCALGSTPKRQEQDC